MICRIGHLVDIADVKKGNQSDGAAEAEARFESEKDGRSASFRLAIFKWADGAVAVAAQILFGAAQIALREGNGIESIAPKKTACEALSEYNAVRVR